MVLPPSGKFAIFHLSAFLDAGKEDGIFRMAGVKAF